MKPKVLLINLPYVVKNIDSARSKIRSFLAFPLGLLSVATYNKDLATFKIIDCDAEQVYQQAIEDAMKEFKPDIVGLSMMFDNSYWYLPKILELVRSFSPKVLTLLGGAAASYSFEEILSEQPLLDAICYSEGEVPLHDILTLRSSIDAHKSWITKQTLKRFPIVAYVENLDDVIDIDYSLVNPDDYGMAEAFSPYAREKSRQFFVLTSRGCFGACRFCSNGILHGRRVRQAGVDRIISHIRHLVDTYGMETLTFYDDCLLFKKDRAKDLFRKLAQFKLRIETPNGLNVAFIDQELAELMAAAGLDTAFLAVESGCEYVLKELINKPLSLCMVKPAVRWLQQAGIFVHTFIVLGMPGETDDHRKETEHFLLDAEVNWAGINLATPVRGSQLYEDCIKNGWIQKQKIGDIEDKKYVIKYPGQDPEEVEKQAYEMNLNINFRNNLDMKRGNYARAAACFQQVLQRYSGHLVAQHYLKICEARLRNNT